MFARILMVDLKPGQGPVYARAIEQQVIPIMRKFAGFRDEIAMVSADGKQAVGISFWERREDAEVYKRDAYPEVFKSLENCMEGTPVVVGYEVTNSTAHAIRALEAGA